MPAGTALCFDKPWEGCSSFYTTVLHDNGAYRMYYRGTPKIYPTDNDPEVTCYAESSDGISWKKPHLGLCEAKGTKDNNVIIAAFKGVNHNFAPFIDAKPGTDPSMRYKALGGTKSTGVFAFASPDGVHWKTLKKEPVIPPNEPLYALDSQNVGFWSEHERCYLFYFRTFHNGVRSVARSVSEDLQNWSEPVVMDFGGELKEHLYVNQTHPYFRAPHIYIALPARFVPDTQALSDEEGESLNIERYGQGKKKGKGRWTDVSETVLMASRGGSRYDWLFKEGYIRPGLDRRNWVGRTNYAACGVVPTGEQEMSLYLQRHYTQPSAFLERFTLRTDGFVSVHAPFIEGEMTTKSFQFDGTTLVLNYATGAAGHLLVEMQDDTGAPISGYTRQDCIPLIGDEIERTVSWKSGNDVRKLSGKPGRIRFVMKDADLYSLRFQ